MKFGLIISTPEVDPRGRLALLTGTFEEKLRKARRLGCDGVELMVRDPREFDWCAIRQQLQDNGLEVPQIVTGELFGADRLCLVTSCDSTFCRAVERTRIVIDFAASLGAIVNIGRLRGRLDLLPNDVDRVSVAVERIGVVADYGASVGVRIALEPVNRYEVDFILNTEDGLRFIEALGRDNVGLMLDLFHMNIEDPSIEGSFRAASSRVWHIHVADSNRRYPGAGHLDFKSLFSTLTTLNYQGYLSAEIIPYPDPDTAAERTLAFLRSQFRAGSR